MTTYWRVDRPNRIERLLDETKWNSRAWTGEFTKRHEDCDGQGCLGCHAQGYVEDVRYGVSACKREDDLYEYMTSHHAYMVGAVIVEIEGELSDDEDHDADDGAVLILPTRIVSTRPVPQEWIDDAADAE